MSAALAFFKALPWRYIAIAAAIAAALFAVQHYLGTVRQQGADAGRREVQAEWDAERAARLAANLETQRLAQAARDRTQHAVDQIGSDQESALAAAKTARDLAVSRGDELRSQLRAYASRPAAGATANCPTPSEPDGRTETLRQLLERADSLAERRTGDAESLADQVRGLQRYANEVSPQ